MFDGLRHVGLGWALQRPVKTMAGLVCLLCYHRAPPGGNYLPEEQIFNLYLPPRWRENCWAHVGRERGQKRVLWHVSQPPWERRWPAQPLRAQKPLPPARHAGKNTGPAWAGGVGDNGCRSTRASPPRGDAGLTRPCGPVSRPPRPAMAGNTLGPAGL